VRAEREGLIHAPATGVLRLAPGRPVEEEGILGEREITASADPMLEQLEEPVDQRQPRVPGRQEPRRRGAHDARRRRKGRQRCQRHVEDPGDQVNDRPHCRVGARDITQIREGLRLVDDPALDP
jgi:hypothetical protein